MREVVVGKVAELVKEKAELIYQGYLWVMSFDPKSPNL